MKTDQSSKSLGEQESNDLINDISERIEQLAAGIQKLFDIDPFPLKPEERRRAIEGLHQAAISFQRAMSECE